MACWNFKAKLLGSYKRYVQNFAIYFTWVKLFVFHHTQQHIIRLYTNFSIFFKFCWPCYSVYLYQYLTSSMHKLCFTISFISCLYMFRAHVLIIRRSKLHYTASGIITAIGGRLVHETATYRCDYTRGCVLTSWWWAHVLETCRGMK